MRPSRPSQRRRALPLIAVALLTVAAACGGDDSDSDETTATTGAAASTTAAPEATDAPATTAAGGTDAPATTAAAAATTAVGTTAPDGPAPTQGGELVTGGIFDAFGLEPATMVGSINDGALGYSLYDPLTSYRHDGSLENWLAESIETTDSQTWTIKIHDGVLFHDGTPLDAEAVKLNLERHKDPNLKSRGSPTTPTTSTRSPWSTR